MAEKPTDKPNREQMSRIAAALADGNKIEAVKVYREATGKDLKVAKDFIDLLAAKLLKENPEKYAKLGPSEGKAKGKGCATVLLAGLGLGLASGAAAWAVRLLL